MEKSREVYINALKKMTPERRFAMASDLIAAQFDSMKAGIKFLNPAAGNAEIDRLFKERLRRIYSLKH